MLHVVYTVRNVRGRTSCGVFQSAEKTPPKRRLGRVACLQIAKLWIGRLMNFSNQSPICWARSRKGNFFFWSSLKFFEVLFWSSAWSLLAVSCSQTIRRMASYIIIAIFMRLKVIHSLGNESKCFVNERLKSTEQTMVCKVVLLETLLENVLVFVKHFHVNSTRQKRSLRRLHEILLHKALAYGTRLRHSYKTLA